MSAGVLMRDVSCRITDSRDLLENAHIIPRSERDWFVRERMGTYNSATDLSPDHIIDDIKNGFLLRRDLHFAFDSSLFCLAVKEGKVVVHFLKRTYEIGAFYHNLEFRLPPGEPSLEFMWARFAWSVFPFIAMFANSPGCLVKPINGPAYRIGSKRPAFIPDAGGSSTPSSTTAAPTARDSSCEGPKKKNRCNTDTINITTASTGSPGTETPDVKADNDHVTAFAAPNNIPGTSSPASHAPESPPGCNSSPIPSNKISPVRATSLSRLEHARDTEKQQHFFPRMSMIRLPPDAC